MDKMVDDHGDGEISPSQKIDFVTMGMFIIGMYDIGLHGSWPRLKLLLSVDCGVSYGGEMSRLSELFGQVVVLQDLIGSDKHMTLQ